MGLLATTTSSVLIPGSKMHSFLVYNTYLLACLGLDDIFYLVCVPCFSCLKGLALEKNAVSKNEIICDQDAECLHLEQHFFCFQELVISLRRCIVLSRITFILGEKPIMPANVNYVLR